MYGDLLYDFRKGLLYNFSREKLHTSAPCADVTPSKFLPRNANIEWANTAKEGRDGS